MDDWDSQNYTVKENWDDEDEQDDLKDNWDDEEEVAEEKPPAQVKPKIEPKKGGKKYMKQMLKEKEEKERLQREEKIAAQLAKTPEDLMREKMEAQKLAEESDFEFAQELLSTKKTVETTAVTIDNFTPSTKEDFTKLVKMLTEKLSSLESSPHYFYLFDSLVSKAMVSVRAEDLKKVASSLNVLANEKTKLEKKKGGKKSTKAKLGGASKAGRNDMYDDYQYDDMDDFM